MAGAAEAFGETKGVDIPIASIDQDESVRLPIDIRLRSVLRVDQPLHWFGAWPIFT